MMWVKGYLILALVGCSLAGVFWGTMSTLIILMTIMKYKDITSLEALPKGCLPVVILTGILGFICIGVGLLSYDVYKRRIRTYYRRIP